MKDVVECEAFAVLGANNSTANDHPRGSPVAAGPAASPGNTTATGTPVVSDLPAERNATGSGANLTITEGVSPNTTAD